MTTFRITICNEDKCGLRYRRVATAIQPTIVVYSPG